MKFRTIKSCCCCLDPKTGSQVLGWFGTFFGLILLALAIHHAVNFEDEFENLRELIKTSLRDLEEAQILVEYRSELRILTYLYVLFSLSITVSSFLLLLGVFQKNLTFIRQWLIVIGLELLVGFVIEVFILYTTVEHLVTGVIVLFVIFDVIVIGKMTLKLHPLGDLKC